MRDVKDLPVGTVINMTATVPAKYPWWKKWILSLVHKAIIAYQKAKYPNSERVNDTHSMVHLGDGDVLNVTWPKAKIEKYNYDPNAVYSFLLWTGATQINDEAQYAMRSVAEKIAGNEYDWLQLIGIAWQKIFAAILKKILPPPFGETIGEPLSIKTLLGLGRTKMVCSTGAHAGLLAAYKALRRSGLNVDRPLGDQWVELTCPADFANHPSFVDMTS